jgi:hypothetical protein
LAFKAGVTNWAALSFSKFASKCVRIFAAFTPRKRFELLELSAGKDYIEGGFQTPLAG